MKSKTQPLNQGVDHLFAQQPPARVREQSAAGEVAGQTLNKAMRRIPMDRIRVKPQVRKANKSTDDVSVQQLAESIRRDGLLNPITVRYVAEGDYFDLIGGERRYNAHRLLGKERIEAHVVNVDDKTRDRMQFIENIQREDLTPLEVGLYLLGQIEAGVSLPDLVLDANKSKSWISRHLKIARRLRGEVADYVSQHPGAFSQNTLYAIADLAEPDQQLEALKHIKHHDFTEQDAKTYLSSLNAEQGDEETTSTGQPKIYKKEIKKKLGAKQRARIVFIIEGKKRATVDELIELNAHAAQQLQKMKGRRVA